MENNTGFDKGDWVVVRGGFEDGIVGLITDVDLSGKVRNRPRFTVQPDTARGGGPIGGLNAINLEKLEADWTEDTGYWDDDARSWVATVEAEQWGPTKTGKTMVCTARIRDESTSKKAPGDVFSWQAVRAGGTSVDRGTAPTLEWAKIHVLKAIVWHGVRQEVK